MRPESIIEKWKLTIPEMMYLCIHMDIRNAIAIKNERELGILLERYGEKYASDAYIYARYYQKYKIMANLKKEYSLKPCQIKPYKLTNVTIELGKYRIDPIDLLTNFVAYNSNPPPPISNDTNTTSDEDENFLELLPKSCEELSLDEKPLLCTPSGVSYQSEVII